MCIRKDVMRQAERLSAESGLDSGAIYAFLMWVWKDKGKNPGLLPIIAIPGKVYVDGEADKYYVEKYVPQIRYDKPEIYTDYESLILARQEAWDI